MNSAINGDFPAGQSLPLYIGPSDNTNDNPGNYQIDLNSVRDLLVGTTPISVSVTTSPTTSPSPSTSPTPQRCKSRQYQKYHR
jgi:hypothetical protein